MTGLFTSIVFAFFICFRLKTGKVNVTTSNSQDSASTSHFVLAAHSLKVQTVEVEQIDRIYR